MQNRWLAAGVPPKIFCIEFEVFYVAVIREQWHLQITN
jgi:hypothetical protein